MIDSFTKAMSELGESILVYSLGLETNSGLAGGFLYKTARQRAKAELIERDAFLYHYKNRIPFIERIFLEKKDNSKLDIFAYKMASTDSSFYSYLVTDEDCSRGNRMCLLFGLGSHKIKNIAISKAIQEYASIALLHEKFPLWCDGLCKKNPNELVAQIFIIWPRGC
jgi:ribosomal protein S12 methylthiotransferase accessory factor YcaO